MRQPIIILTGPTAVGKTALSIKLAKQIGGEIISADSMQVYRSLDIGSAKIQKEEMEGVPHYLIDVLDPRESFHAVLFQSMAKQALAQVYQKGKIPIVAGGTGFYIQALLYDVDFTESDTDPAYRAYLERLAKEKGDEYLHDLLKTRDPDSARDIHAHNRKRMIRALEFYEQTGRKISEHNREQRQNTSPYNFCYFVLTMDRAKLYERIDMRVDQMIENGLLDEVKQLREKGYTKDLVSMQGIGYQELMRCLEGDLSFDEAVRQIKRNTRHFAKRQLTWFRREKEVIWIDKDAYRSEQDILAFMLQNLKEKGITEE